MFKEKKRKCEEVDGHSGTFPDIERYGEVKWI